MRRPRSILGYTAEEIDPEGFLDNPFAFANAVVRSTLSYPNVAAAKDRSHLRYEEISREAIVALYLELNDSREIKSRDERTRQIFSGVASQLRRYIYAEAGRKGVIQFSQFGNDESDPIEFASPYSFEEEAMREVWIDAILRQAERVLKTARYCRLDGEHDWQVFQRFAQGANAEEILAECPWLKSKDSVENVITRCVLLVRTDLNVDLNMSIRGLCRPRRIEGSERFNSKAYQKKHYYENLEERRAKARENMRRIRAARKAQK